MGIDGSGPQEGVGQKNQHTTSALTVVKIIGFPQAKPSTLNRRSIDAQSTLQSTLNRRLVFIVFSLISYKKIFLVYLTVFECF